MDILTAAQSLKDTIIKWRRDLHQIPELDLDLPQTRDYVCERLTEMGIPYQTFEGNSSVCATLTGANAGATVALRADMDALHIKEETGLPFASTNGNMHACGHDTHTAMLLGAAKILSDMRDQLFGNVKFLFQAGEEGSGGAADMITNGVLSDPEVGAVFGQHVGSMSSELPPGKFGFLAGDFMASRDSFTITVKGKGCHGSQPALGVDPVAISAYLITTLQTLVSRECSIENPAVLTIGAIHGGHVYNVIPDEVTMNGAIRCYGEDRRAYFEQRIKEVCESVCVAMRGSCIIDYEHGYPATINDPKMTKLAMDTARKLLGEEKVYTLKHPMTGSEDMSFFLQERPGCYWIAATDPTDEPAYPNHNSKFTVNEDMLPMGTALLAKVACDWLDMQKKTEC